MALRHSQATCRFVLANDVAVSADAIPGNVPHEANQQRPIFRVRGPEQPRRLDVPVVGELLSDLSTYVPACPMFESGSLMIINNEGVGELVHKWTKERMSLSCTGGIPPGVNQDVEVNLPHRERARPRKQATQPVVDILVSHKDYEVARRGHALTNPKLHLQIESRDPFRHATLSASGVPNP